MDTKAEKVNTTEAASAVERKVRRAVEFHEGNAGIWDITCPTCPLRPHTDALGEKPRVCAHGIYTNIQGPVPMGTCKHHKAESLLNGGTGLSLECTKDA